MHLDRLVRALERAAPRGVRVAARMITAGDERALDAEERAAARTVHVDRLRASGAARIAARTILGDLGHHGVSIPRSETGAPKWPAGVVGSIAHDEEVAVAIVARREGYAAVGVDVEPALPLPPDLTEIVATAKEKAWLRGDRLGARALFCAKEAIFKAVHPLDGACLDHHDIELDSSLRASVRGGRRVHVCLAIRPRIAAIASVAKVDLKWLR